MDPNASASQTCRCTIPSLWWMVPPLLLSSQLTFSNTKPVIQVGNCWWEWKNKEIFCRLWASENCPHNWEHQAECSKDIVPDNFAEKNEKITMTLSNSGLVASEGRESFCGWKCWLLERMSARLSTSVGSAPICNFQTQCFMMICAVLNNSLIWKNYHNYFTTRRSLNMLPLSRAYTNDSHT
jgi:hypothetical protein